MKTQIVLPVVLLAIIAVLVGSLIYEILERNRAGKNAEQFIIAISVQSFQSAAEGDTDAIKRRLGALVTAQSEHYEQQYGYEADAKFAPMLAQAKLIQAEFEAMSK